MLNRLVITRGLPGCGKSTYAREWVANDRAHRVRLTRDDFRTMMHGFRLGTPDQERQVTAAQHAAISAVLAMGVAVICDDTNLNPRDVETLRRLAASARAQFVVVDMTDVDVETCVSRDARRAGRRRVGAKVIRTMHSEWIEGNGYPLPLPGLDF